MNNEFVFWNGDGQISPHLLYDYLNNEGIGKYFFDDEKRKKAEPILVKITGNIVSEINVGYLLEIIKNHILECTEKDGQSGPILDSLHGRTGLFGDKNLKLLNTLTIDFISDTPETGYFFFRNGIVAVSKESVLLCEYGDFEHYVWEDSVIPMDFVPLEGQTIFQYSEFGKFLEDLTVTENAEQSSARLSSLASAVGYLIHRYKDSATTKAIILMDVYVNGQPNGGSGKTLLVNSIGKVRRLSIIDGKKYDKREWFGLSSVDIGNEVLLFDDVERNFDMEPIFPLMTTGLELKRKYKNHVFIPFEKSPKIALTTNYAINGSSSSFRRRMFEFEVSPTYSADFSPREKFGHNFFEDWSGEQWNLFYNTLFFCLQTFLNNGLVESAPINLDYTKLINRTCDEFPEWAEMTIQAGQYDKKELYDQFLAVYPEYSGRLKQRDFTFWLRSWGEYKLLAVEETHSDEKRHINFKSL